MTDARHPVRRQPFMGLTEDEFLTGPDGDGQRIVVDDILGKTLERAVREMLQASGPAAFAIDPDEPVTRSIVDPDLLFISIECGTVLLDGHGRIVGGMIECDLVLDPAFHDRGLGRELVVEHVLRHDDLTVWSHDTPGYTRAGARTVRSAHRWLSRLGNLTIKKAALDRPAGLQPIPPEIDLAPFRPSTAKAIDPPVPSP